MNRSSDIGFGKIGFGEIGAGDIGSVDFDAVTVAQGRRRQGSKWSRYGDEVLPSFVADMDFPLASPIHQALAEQLAVNDYGYVLGLDERPLREIFASWAARRFSWDVDPASIEGLVDIVQGIYLAIEQYSSPGDGVLTLTPTYPPLWKSPEQSGRRLVACELVKRGDQYEIDFDRLRAQLTEGPTQVSMLLLCNPHNPTGRVFTRAELEQLGELVLEFGLVVLADEIHADLVYAPHKHIPFASLGGKVAQQTITMTSATKSFNLGGMRFAIAVFGSQQLQQRFNEIPKGKIGGLNSMGALATEIAWSQCDPWLDSLVAYLQSNRDFLVNEVRQRFPQVVMPAPQSTYLAWLDCGQLPLNARPFDHFLNAGQVALGQGLDFAPDADDYVRLNFGTSQPILTAVLDRMSESLPSGAAGASGSE